MATLPSHLTQNGISVILYEIAMKGNNEESNPQSELSFEKLRTYEGFENVTEEEAQIQIEIIKKLARILHYMYMNEQQMNNDINKEL